MLRARLDFPELFFEVDVSTAGTLAADVEDLREGRNFVLTVDCYTGERDAVVDLVASRVPERDSYLRTSRRLTVMLSPEAIEHLLFKIEELRALGDFSTPEFYEFHGTDAEGSPEPRGKTLRAFLHKSRR